MLMSTLLRQLKTNPNIPHCDIGVRTALRRKLLEGIAKGLINPGIGRGGHSEFTLTADGLSLVGDTVQPLHTP